MMNPPFKMILFQLEIRLIFNRINDQTFGTVRKRISL